MNRQRALFSALLVVGMVLVGAMCFRPGQVSATSSQTYYLYLPFLGRAAPLQTVFGVEMSSIGASDGFDLFPARAVSPTTWVRRAALSWAAVEAAEGVYNWNAAGLDAELSLAAQNGLRVILVVRDAPAWAAARACGPVNSAKFPAFANFLAAAAARYPSVQYWELWNEPDIDFAVLQDPNSLWGCWGDQADAYYGGGQYGEMLKVVYPVLKAANSSAQIVAGSLLLDCDPSNPPVGKDCQSGKFLEGLLRVGAGAALDGVSFHAYDYYSGGLGQYTSPFNSNSRWDVDGPAVVSKARFVKARLAQYGVTGKFLMNTESAILYSSDACDGACLALNEQTRAAYVAEAYAAALAEGLRANVWFRTLGWPGRNSALLDGSLQPLPAYYAYQTAAGLLSGAVYVDALTGEAGLKGYRFSLGQRRLWLVWSPDGVVRTLNLSATPTRVLDVLGQSQAISGASWQVGASPVWIELP